MAEYISRDLAIEKTDYLVLETCYDCEKVEVMLRDIPTADVIERSKIDKAIEEIKQDMMAHSGTGEEVIQAYCDGLKKALEILKNIGE